MTASALRLRRIGWAPIEVIAGALVSAGLMLGAALGGASALAQPLAPHAITVIVPYPGGSAGDVVARAITQVVGDQTGQSFVIDNKPGASMAIGMRAGAQARPDGATILFTSVAAMALAPAMKRSLPYDPVKSYEPIALTLVSPLYLAVRKDFPAQSAGQLVDVLRGAPGKFTYGTGGPGSISHFAGELLKERANLDIVAVPYAGAGPALRDVVSGHIDMTFTGSALAVADQVKLLATTGAKRTAAMPQLPAIAELGLGDYSVASWFGFLAPAGTPREPIDKLAGAIKHAFDSGDLGRRLKAINNDAELVTLGPDAFRDFIVKEIPAWQELVRLAKLPVEN